MMKEEIKGPLVEKVSVAIVLEDDNTDIYNVYLINFRDDIMEGIIITSVGYGENAVTGEKIETSTLRHSLEVLLPNEAAKIEAIMPEVFSLYNEYWVSFWVNDDLFDKRFVFNAETIIKSQLKELAFFGKKGVILN
jgi:hypothetical protein